MDFYSWIALVTFLAAVAAVWKIRKRKDYKYSLLDISGIITHRIDVAQYEEGFAAMNSGKCGKVILDWTSLQ